MFAIYCSLLFSKDMFFQIGGRARGCARARVCGRVRVFTFVLVPRRAHVRTFACTHVFAQNAALTRAAARMPLCTAPTALLLAATAVLRCFLQPPL
jgi:hypothetical protein